SAMENHAQKSGEQQPRSDGTGQGARTIGCHSQQGDGRYRASREGDDETRSHGFSQPGNESASPSAGGTGASSAAAATAIFPRSKLRFSLARWKRPRRTVRGPRVTLADAP